MSTSPTQRYCEDCKWARRAYGAHSERTGWWCERPDASGPTLHIVRRPTNPSFKTCYSERWPTNDPERCGAEGRHWEEKVSWWNDFLKTFFPLFLRS